ncbi:alpha/beta hydrolase [Streptosporangium carneum]|uniref:Uncharacterized protein n=1 Tax=Streptosporangium carneum TaxID=47481 RepID=A0A9W6MGB9_9ACTN|nr:alpha/beta hydrolase [Streptosporangium carneum]GLK13000.1 hypothetical protein GCM10017600_64100 [Streptosporangium carneum]
MQALTARDPQQRLGYLTAPGFTIISTPHGDLTVRAPTLIVPGIGHAVSLECPDLVNERILDLAGNTTVSEVEN